MGICGAIQYVCIQRPIEWMLKLVWTRLNITIIRVHIRVSLLFELSMPAYVYLYVSVYRFDMAELYYHSYGYLGCLFNLIKYMSQPIRQFIFMMFFSRLFLHHLLISYLFFFFGFHLLSFRCMIAMLSICAILYYLIYQLHWEKLTHEMSFIRNYITDSQNKQKKSFSYFRYETQYDKTLIWCLFETEKNVLYYSLYSL